jgi:type IV pilus assembly protein PilM
MLFGKPNSFLGIDLGAGGVKLVELKEVKKRPVLFTYAATTDGQDVHRLLKEVPQFQVPGGPLKSLPNSPEPAVKPDSLSQDKINQYSRMLKAVCKRARVVAKSAAVSLPVSAVFHAVVTLPNVKKEEFDHLLKAEIKKLLPYAIEEAAFDYQILPGAPEATARRVLINAVPRSLVVFYSRVFLAAGLKLEALEPESVALARCLVGRDRALSMIVDIGAERTNFFIVDGSVPMTHHSIEIGGNRLTDLLSTVWHTQGPLTEALKQDLFTALSKNPGSWPLSRERLLSLMAPLVDPISKEIDYSLDVYLRQTGNEKKRLEKVILTGGGAAFPYLGEHIAEQFKIKCYVGDPWGRVVYQERLKPIIAGVGPRLAVAIGLALRNVV